MIFITTSFAGFALGDGGIFGKGMNIIYQRENSQYAVINYANGQEKMFITVNFNWEESNKSAWVLPVPSDAENVKIDIPYGLLEFNGRDFVSKAKENLEEYYFCSLYSYLFSFVAPTPITINILYMMTTTIGPPGIGGIEIHEHLEKHGLTAEVISATEGLGIYNYLVDNGLDISEGIVPQLDKYVNMDYSFIVMWLSDSNITTRTPALTLEFPTNKIYYPLMLTSIYGNDVIPTEVIVVGHVTPTVFEDIKPYCDVTYYDQANYDDTYAGVEMENFDHRTSWALNNFTYDIQKNWDGAFTHIILHAPSNTYTRDLWMEARAPDKIDHAKSINNYFTRASFFVFYVFFFLTFSLLFGLLLGILVFGNKKKEFPYYLIMGIGNSFGIIGLIISTYFIRKYRKYKTIKCAIFVTLLSFIFTITIIIFFSILLFPFR